MDEHIPISFEDFTNHPSFEAVVVDTNEIKKFTTEDEFMELAFVLLREVGVLTSALSGVYPLDEKGQPRLWTRNEAILSGLMIRLSKLQMGLLDNINQNRLEIVSILSRCLYETIIVLEYLITQNSDKLFDEYVEYSLRQEKKLLTRIKENITLRGYELPIETRMKASLFNTFSVSGLKPENVDEKKRTPWGGSIFKKAEKIGMAEAYLGIFALPSHSIHGNWQDLLQFHIEDDKDGFIPSPRWTEPRPQTVFAAAMLSGNACQCYAKNCLPESEDSEIITERVSDFLARVQKTDDLHEFFYKMLWANIWF